MPLLYFAYAFPVGIWIFLDSKRIFGSTPKEALLDTGYLIGLANLTSVIYYFKKRNLEDITSKNEVR